MCHLVVGLYVRFVLPGQGRQTESCDTSEYVYVFFSQPRLKEGSNSASLDRKPANHMLVAQAALGNAARL